MLRTITKKSSACEVKIQWTPQCKSWLSLCYAENKWPVISFSNSLRYVAKHDRQVRPAMFCSQWVPSELGGVRRRCFTASSMSRRSGNTTTRTTVANAKKLPHTIDGILHLLGTTTRISATAHTARPTISQWLKLSCSNTRFNRIIQTLSYPCYTKAEHSNFRPVNSFRCVKT